MLAPLAAQKAFSWKAAVWERVIADSFEIWASGEGEKKESRDHGYAFPWQQGIGFGSQPTHCSI